ncbi:MAG: ABC transporter ATP-binding protein [Actinomycetota bacterium]|nr:ABC transporter ATP-binding protein [Actinomycetota bacterium]
MADTVVLDHVTKNFALREALTLKRRMVSVARRKPMTRKFTAIDDVSFAIQEGEAIGLMGLNGSGKSTLLKMISGVLRPDGGTVRTRGHVAGLIEVTAGFHLQLTGRENIYLNAAIMGMSEREIERRFDGIVDFAGIEEFLDQPVSRYSSGMFARLGFSIAVAADSDVFIIDEVLAVGDPPFKKKCLARIREIRDEGRTIVFVSHNTTQVKRICTKAVVLEKGRMTYYGDVPGAISQLHYDQDGDDDTDAEGGEI